MPQDRYIVIVLGAGASRPFGFPLGRSLMQRAATFDPFSTGHPRFSFDLADLDDDLRFTVQDFRRFQEALAGSRCATIDTFLLEQPQYRHIGRMIVALLITASENAGQVNALDNDGDWVRRMLAEGLVTCADQKPLRAASGSSVHFVTFNYDRSLEYALTEAVAGRGLGLATENEILKTVYHVYGDVGGVGRRTGNGRAFGSLPTSEQLQGAARSLRFIGAAGETRLDERSENCLACAEHVVFLGFGYHLENIALLNLAGLCVDRLSLWPMSRRLWHGQHKIPRSAAFHGSAFRISERSRGQIRSHFAKIGAINLAPEESDATTALDYLYRVFEG